LSKKYYFLDRVGGRTLTIDLKCAKEGQTSKWDIGGQWVCIQIFYLELIGKA
jgi:hypothetical protein